MKFTTKIITHAQRKSISILLQGYHRNAVFNFKNHSLIESLSISALCCFIVPKVGHEVPGISQYITENTLSPIVFRLPPYSMKLCQSTLHQLPIYYSLPLIFGVLMDPVISQLAWRFARMRLANVACASCHSSYFGQFISEKNCVSEAKSMRTNRRSTA